MSERCEHGRTQRLCALCNGRGAPSGTTSDRTAEAAEAGAETLRLVQTALEQFHDAAQPFARYDRDSAAISAARNRPNSDHARGGLSAGLDQVTYAREVRRLAPAVASLLSDAAQTRLKLAGQLGLGASHARLVGDTCSHLRACGFAEATGRGGAWIRSAAGPHGTAV